MKITLVQFGRGEDKGENIERMYDYLRKLDGTDLVCLAENWYGTEPLSGKEFDGIIRQFKNIASKKNFHLIMGAGYIVRGSSIFDSCYVISKSGKILGNSDKMFPSESVGETKFLSKGEKMPVFEIDGINFGLVICVDAVYPEISRYLANSGAEVIFNPSNIPNNRIGMWKSIGITRAVENGVFFVFINNTSTYYPDGREVTGHSFVASPDGEILSELDENEQIYNFRLDLEMIDEVRSRWDFLERIKRSDLF